MSSVEAQYHHVNLDGVQFVMAPTIAQPVSATPVLTGIVIPPDPENNNEIVDSIQSTIIDVEP